MEDRHETEGFIVSDQFMCCLESQLRILAVKVTQGEDLRDVLGFPIVCCYDVPAFQWWRLSFDSGKMATCMILQVLRFRYGCWTSHAIPYDDVLDNIMPREITWSVRAEQKVQEDVPFDVAINRQEVHERERRFVDKDQGMGIGCVELAEEIRCTVAVCVEQDKIGELDPCQHLVEG